MTSEHDLHCLHHLASLPSPCNGSRIMTPPVVNGSYDSEETGEAWTDCKTSAPSTNGCGEFLSCSIQKAIFRWPPSRLHIVRDGSQETSLLARSKIWSGLYLYIVFAWKDRLHIQTLMIAHVGHGFLEHAGWNGPGFREWYDSDNDQRKKRFKDFRWSRF